MRKQTSGPGHVSSAIRLVALFEGFKGVLVLTAASGLLLLIHKDVHAIAARLVSFTHLNPASKYPQIFLDAANNIHDSRLVLLALGAAAYSAVRLIEAYGLLFGKGWAQIFAAFSGAIYVPVEVLELIRHVTLMRAIILVTNIVVVVIMVCALSRRRSSSTQSST